VLGGRVRGGVRARRGSGDGAVVDDTAAARQLRLHKAKCGLCTEKWAGEVHVHDAPPLLDSQVLKMDWRSAAAGVVAEDIEPPACRVRLVKKQSHGGGVADIRGNS